MVSDVLFDAVEDIKKYLVSETYKTVYHGDTRREIEILVAYMDSVREMLDTPPFADCYPPQ